MICCVLKIVANQIIYQVLAVRMYEKDSRKIHPFAPLERIGIDFECIKLEPLLHSWLMTIVVAIIQTYGLSVVVLGLIGSYLDGIEGKICVMDEDRWMNVIHYKLLAFFLSLVVTFVIGDKLGEIQDSGLNKMISTLKPKHIKRVPNVAAINYYVCLFAVIGSYFIIFEANGDI